jgi:hypothetical protein
MDLAHLLEARLRARLSQRHKGTELESVLQAKREAIVELLLRLLDTMDAEPAVPPAPVPTVVPGAKEQPTPEILDKAVKLQALALHSPEEHERAAAWRQFEKLWQKYHLPSNLGM